MGHNAYFPGFRTFVQAATAERKHMDTGATRIALKIGRLFMVKKMTGHKTNVCANRYVQIGVSDLVEVMHSNPSGAPDAMASSEPLIETPSADSMPPVPGAMGEPPVEAKDSRVIRVDFKARSHAQGQA